MGKGLDQFFFQESIGGHFTVFIFGSIFEHPLERGLKRFGDAFGCLLGVPSRSESSDSVWDILKKLSFAHDQLPEPFLKRPGKDSRAKVGAHSSDERARPLARA